MSADPQREIGSYPVTKHSTPDGVRSFVVPLPYKHCTPYWGAARRLWEDSEQLVALFDSFAILQSLNGHSFFARLVNGS